MGNQPSIAVRRADTAATPAGQAAHFRLPELRRACHPARGRPVDISHLQPVFVRHRCRRRKSRHHREGAIGDQDADIPIGARARLGDIEWEVVGYMRRCDGPGDFRWTEYLLFNPYQGYRIPRRGV